MTQSNLENLRSQIASVNAKLIRLNSAKNAQANVATLLKNSVRVFGRPNRTIDTTLLPQ